MLHQAKIIKVLLISFIFLAFAIPIYAESPFVQTAVDYGKGIQIQFPQFNYLEFNKNYTFNIHVYNSTNFYLTNATTTCTLDVYTKNGTEVYEQAMDFILPNNFYTIIPHQNMSILGTYGYIVQCNNTDESGFISSTLRVTKDGEDDTTLDGSAGLSITIFIILVALFFLALPFIVQDFAENKITNLIIKRMFVAIGIVLLSLESAMIGTIADKSNIPLTSEMFNFMFIFGVLGYVFLIYVMFKTLFDVFNLWKEEKTSRRMGEDDI